MLGFAGLTFGTPELGYSSLAAIAAIRVRFGLAIKRGMPCRPRFAMSAYTEAVHVAGRVVERGPERDDAANDRKSASISRPDPP